MISKEVLDEVFHEITEENDDIITTGFVGIDALLEGNRKPYLITLGARPSMGKTSFAVSVLLNFLKYGKNCLVFSNDISETVYLKRLVAQIGELCLVSLKNKSSINDTQKLKIKKALDKISKYKLTVNDEYVDISDIKEQIETVKPDYVFIDNIQLLAEKITAKSLKRLNQIAEDNNCTIFVLSGLSRAPENRKDKRPLLSDLINAKDIVNVSDVVMFLYRDRYYYFREENENNNPNTEEAEIIIAKNKNGAVGADRVIFNHSTTKFSNPKWHDVFEDYDTIYLTLRS